ncbi:hypothetical protein GGI07_004379 [Coemansia sp. Benny D115]|nr:hypothetical protein GGI07_004379 [Coemansia sp. Benny D115]
MAALPLIRISPSEFQFTESGSGYTSRLRLTSLQNQAVGFKFKTNAPHKFLVKPVVCSLNKRGATVEVVVKSTSAITDCDRFLIQTVALATDEAEGLDSAKWRKLDPSRIMEDLIHCTMGRRTSVSSQGSGSYGSPPLVAVSQMYGSGGHQNGAHYQPLVEMESSLSVNEKPDGGRAAVLVKTFYEILPGIDIADWSWTEFAMFLLVCVMIGFLLPALGYAITS